MIVSFRYNFIAFAYGDNYDGREGELVVAAAKRTATLPCFLTHCVAASAVFVGDALWVLHINTKAWNVQLGARLRTETEASCRDWNKVSAAAGTGPGGQHPRVHMLTAL